MVFSTRMNHVHVSFATKSFIVGHVGAAMKTEWRIWDLGVIDGRVNIPIPLPLWSM